MIPDLGTINTQNPGISNVGIGIVNSNTIGMQNINVRDTSIRNVNVADTRIWIRQPAQAVPTEVPVTVFVGKPIVNMPGCVKLHRENTGRDPSTNKQLVNNDPKGNTVLCDSGMPYFNPADYQADKLNWETIYGKAPEVTGGVDTGDSPEPPIPETPEPPITPAATAKVVECPPNNARRIGDLSQSGKEKVKGYELNETKTECITLWEDVPWTQEFLPDPGIVTTTASIAAVATTSALLAKPLADLLLKVVKPTVKKVIAKVKSVLGKKDPVLSLRERMLAQRDRNRAIMALRKAVKK